MGFMRTWKLVWALPGVETKKWDMFTVNNSSKSAKAEATRFTKQTGKWVDMTPQTEMCAFNPKEKKEVWIKLIDGGGQLELIEN